MTTNEDPHAAGLPAFKEALVAHGLMLPGDVRGVWGRGPVFEDILERFDALLMRDPEAAKAEPLTFPPIIARKLVERMGYLGTFPNLIGSIHGFVGDDAEAREMAALGATGERWEHLLEPTEMMLMPAACYPLYPIFSGLLPEAGRLLAVRNWVFRHEPSDEPTRTQSFRMRELVKMGEAEAIEAWRDEWLQRGLELLRSLGLPVESDLANDPFFGRTGRVLASQQRQHRLKFEIVVPVISSQKPTAIASFNWHQEHFSAIFGIEAGRGRLAQSGCVAFGLERIVLALLRTHGCEPAKWPAEVRQRLWS